MGVLAIFTLSLWLLLSFLGFFVFYLVKLASLCGNIKRIPLLLSFMVCAQLLQILLCKFPHDISVLTFVTALRGEVNVYMGGGQLLPVQWAAGEVRMKHCWLKQRLVLKQGEPPCPSLENMQFEFVFKRLTGEWWLSVVPTVLLSPTQSERRSYAESLCQQC